MNLLSDTVIGARHESSDALIMNPLHYATACCLNYRIASCIA